MIIEGFRTYQILIIFIAVYSILRSIYFVVRKRKDIRELFVSIIIWTFFALLSLFPNLSLLLADITGFELGINALLVIAVLYLLYSNAKQSLKNDKIENTITKIVRNQALDELKKSDKSK